MMRKNCDQQFKSSENKPSNYDYDYGMLQFQQTKLLRQQNKNMEMKLIKARQMQHKMDMILCHNQEIVELNQSLKKKITSLYSENKKLKTELNQALYDLSIYKNQDKKHLNISQKISEELSLNRLKKWQLEGFNSCHKNQIENLRKRIIQEQSRNLEKTQKFIRQIEILNQLVKALETKISTQDKAYKQMKEKYNKIQTEKLELNSDLKYNKEEHKRQLDNLRAKMEVQFIIQLDNIKKRQKCQIQTLQGQNQILKNSISDMRLQFNQMKLSNQKIKLNYQESIKILKDNLKESEILIAKLSSDHKFELNLVNQKIKEKIDAQVVIAKTAHKHTFQQQEAQIIALYQLLKQKNQTIIENNSNHSKVRTQLQNEVIKSKQELQFCLKELSQITHRFDSVHKDDTLHLKQQIIRLNQELSYYRDLLSKRQDQCKLILQEKQIVEKKITMLIQEVTHISEQKMKTLDMIEKQMRQLRQANSSARSSQGSQRDKLSKKLKSSLQLKDKEIEQLGTNLLRQKQVNRQRQKLIQTLKRSIQDYQQQIKEKQALIIQLGTKQKDFTERLTNLQVIVKNASESPRKIKKDDQDKIQFTKTISKTQQQKLLSSRQLKYGSSAYDQNKTIQRLKRQHQFLQKEVKEILKQEAIKKYKQFDSNSNQANAHFRQDSNTKKQQRNK